MLSTVLAAIIWLPIGTEHQLKAKPEDLLTEEICFHVVADPTGDGSWGQDIGQLGCVPVPAGCTDVNNIPACRTVLQYTVPPGSSDIHIRARSKRTVEGVVLLSTDWSADFGVITVNPSAPSLLP